MTGMPDEVVRLHEVTKEFTARSFPRRVRAVSNLDLVVERGQVLGLLGPNGCGKTTTIAMMCGLISPTGGDITISGFNLRNRRKEALSRIGAVLDRARALYPRLTPLQNMEYFTAMKGMRRRAVANGLAWLERFGAGEYARVPVNNLSLGTRQKAVLACAMAVEPDVLLLDEPTLGLDVPSSLELRSILSSIAADKGTSVIISTHQMDVAQSVCHKVCIMHQGEVLVQSSVGQLLDVFASRAYSISIRGRLTRDLRHDLERAGTVVSSSEYSGAAGDFSSIHMEFVSENALFEAIDSIRARGVEVESVGRLEPCLQSAYLRITGGEKPDVRGSMGRVEKGSPEEVLKPA